MRKLMFSLLLASAAAAPALAQPNDRQQAREEREQAREERQQVRQESRQESRSERAETNRPERAQLPVEVNRQQSDNTARTQAFDRRNGNAEARRQRMDDRQQAADVRRDIRTEERAQFREEHMSPVRAPVVSNTPRPGTQPPVRTEYRPSPTVHWNTNWRNNNKYDWHNHRHHHRSLFHLGFYYDPFGWGYSPFQIGWRMWPSYYGSRYWISDPWMYRLPYAPPGYRWIRYWNDAVLVDTWNGQVVDVIYNFFW